MTKKNTWVDHYATETPDTPTEDDHITVSWDDLMRVLDAMICSNGGEVWPIDIEEYDVEDQQLIELVQAWTERVDAA